MSEQEVMVRGNLRSQWDLFQEALVESEVMLKRCKATMKKTLQEDLTGFVSQVADIRSCTLCAQHRDAVYRITLASPRHRSIL